jgi:uncharacterized protein (TIGR02145 family)
MMIKQLVFTAFSFLVLNISLYAQNIECIDNLIEIPLTGYKAGDIHWQFSTDKISWMDLESQNTELLSYNIQETGYFRAEIIDLACTYYSDTVYIKAFPYPTKSNAGKDTILTDDKISIMLAANTPSVGTGYWSVVSGERGSFADSTDAGTDFTGQHCTDYTLRWTITTPCSSSSDDVIIGFNQVPTVAETGADQTFTDGTISTTLAANTPEAGHGTGQWSIVSGDGGSFDDETSPTAVFTGQKCSSYQLQWTITTSCNSSSDIVNITFNQTPTVAQAGADQTFTDGTISTTLAANTPEAGHGTGQWSIVSGDGGSFDDPSDPNTTFSGIVQSTYNLQWTISTNCQVSEDDLKVNFFHDGALGNQITDIEGNSYNTVWIGGQNWMAENLKTAKYNDGTDILNVTDDTEWSNLSTGAYCWHDNDQATYGSFYGALYNWYAVNTDKLCPSDWHVPTDAEWVELENYLADNGYNYDGTIGGGRDKIAKSLASTEDWAGVSITTPYIGEVGRFLIDNNRSGFTALPAGRRTVIDGLFDNMKYYGCWWYTSKGATGTEAGYRFISNSSPNVYRARINKSTGFSVRCVKDN